MKNLLHIFLFLATVVSYSQKICVLSKEDYSPISYSKITFDNGGFYTNSDGCFITSDIPKKIQAIKISNLGYKELTLSKDRIPDTILLTPVVNELKEITLTDKNKNVILKPKKSIFIHHQSWPLNNFSELCTCLYAEKYIDAKINEATFRFKRNKWNSSFSDDVRAILKFNVYNGNDTLFENKIYQSKSYAVPNTTTDVNVDFKDINITFDKDGVCFGIEMLGHLKDEVLLKDKSSVRPILHSKESKNYAQKTFVKHYYNDTIIPLINFFNKNRLRKKQYKRRNMSIGLKLKH